MRDVSGKIFVDGRSYTTFSDCKTFSDLENTSLPNNFFSSTAKNVLRATVLNRESTLQITNSWSFFGAMVIFALVIRSQAHFRMLRPNYTVNKLPACWVAPNLDQKLALHFTMQAIRNFIEDSSSESVKFLKLVD